MAALRSQEALPADGELPGNEDAGAEVREVPPRNEEEQGHAQDEAALKAAEDHAQQDIRVPPAPLRAPPGLAQGFNPFVAPPMNGYGPSPFGFGGPFNFQHSSQSAFTPPQRFQTEQPPSNQQHAARMEQPPLGFLDPQFQGMLTHMFAASEDRIASRIEQKLSAVQDSVSAGAGSSSFESKKRKGESLKNEGIKKQYVPLEEASLHMHEVRDRVAAVADGDLPPLGPEDAEKLRQHLDEGIDICSKRLQFLEIAESEGWNVLKKVEEQAFISTLPDELQAQVKKAKKAVKEDEQSKEKKKSSGRKFRGG
ncbi:hypothetical protein KFL_006130010, partial [Klebsormidium nitens]